MSVVSHSVVPQTKIDACCDVKSTRYAMGAVEIIPSGNKSEVYCSATDGRVATVAVATGEAQGIALLPVKLAKPGHTVSLNGRWECNGKVASVVEGRFPRLEECFPEVPACELSSYSVLVLKGHQLKVMADAIGCEGELTLFVPPNSEKGYVNRPIAARGTYGIGVIMPTVASNDAQSTYETMRKHYSEARRAAHKAADEAARGQ
jgi:hypothetical protein